MSQNLYQIDEQKKWKRRNSPKKKKGQKVDRKNTKSPPQTIKFHMRPRESIHCQTSKQTLIQILKNTKKKKKKNYIRHNQITNNRFFSVDKAKNDYIPRFFKQLSSVGSSRAEFL